MEIQRIQPLSMDVINNTFFRIQQSYNILLNENRFLKEKFKKPLSISRDEFEIIQFPNTIYLSNISLNSRTSEDDKNNNVRNNNNNMNDNNLNKKENLNDDNIANENYDFILQITRMIDLFDVGWDYYCSDKFKKYLNDYTINYLIGIFGDKYSGKSFVLRKIFNINITYKGKLIPSLSFKLFQDKFVIFETISTNIPLYNIIKKIEKIDINLKDEEKEKREIETQNATKLNELFIREYIFKLSNLCIYVINILGYNELKILMEIENNIKSNLIVIHNLFMLNSLEEINNYYNKILIMQIKNLQSQPINSSNHYFYFEERNNKTIIHLILGNDNITEVKSYNQEIIEYLKNQIQSKLGKKINFFQQFEEMLQKFIPKYFNVMEKNIQYTNIIKDINLFKERKLKLKHNKILYNNQNINNLHIRFRNISVNYYNGQYREKKIKIIKQYKIYITENNVSIEFDPKGDVLTNQISANVNPHSFEAFIDIIGLYNKIEQKNDEFIFNNMKIYDKFILTIDKEKFDKLFLNLKKNKIEKKDNYHIIIKFEIVNDVDENTQHLDFLDDDF